ncbi:MAG: arginine--tRNA ligase [Planctomycetales bacterium]|nr:arginine--tRNA ligase [Planctomycetales bacterium]
MTEATKVAGVRRAVAERIAAAAHVPITEAEEALEYPPDPAFGDLAFPCFGLAKARRAPPPKVAADLAGALVASPPVEGWSAAGPYLNVRLDSSLAREVLGNVLAEDACYGGGSEGAGKTVVVDYSAPNIGKPIAFHHIRSTMIGNALVRILRARGHRVVGVNHLGDWGTQFGYLLEALAGKTPAEVRAKNVRELSALYVAGNERAKKEPAVEDAARAAFARLERGDPGSRALWEACRDVSLREFDRIYRRLGVTFEATTGESFYEPRLAPLLADLERRGIATTSQGALVVDLSADGIATPCLLRKSDGATLYATRDVAAAIYRAETYGMEQALYLTDQGQSLHFKQWFAVVRRMGFGWAAGLVHVPFGVLLIYDEAEKEWTRGKTRSGRVVLLEEVLDESVRRARALIAEKNPALPAADAVAEQVGVGAVVFNDLKNRREKEVRFRFEDALRFDGDAGPYVQNAHVRACGIFRNAGRGPEASADVSLLAEPEARAVVAQLLRFPDAVARAAREAEPCHVAGSLLEISTAFHRFYHEHRVLGGGDPRVEGARLLLVHGVRVALRNGLGLLGLAAPEEM